ncbi:MAG: hypothetical protein CMK23_06395 [Porticoccaceae bacterium]|nr:hypothetical protein [Porticoccaceae bacterium]
MKICFVGTGRSGTTLICDMFGDHPDLLMYTESYWHPILFERFGMRAISAHEQLRVVREVTFPVPKKRKWYRRHKRTIAKHPVIEITLARYDLNPHEIFEEFLEKFGDIEQTIAEFCDALSGVILHRLGKSLWGDKTPHYFHKMQLLQAIWPDVVFVNVIRHGVAVARSMQKHIGFQVIQNLGVDSWTSVAEVHEFLECPERDVSLNDYLTMWARQILRSRDEATRLLSGSYTEVYFEDLITQPANVLQSICEFADLDCDAAWLDRQRAIVRSDRLSIGGQIDGIPSMAKDVLHTLGYSMDTPLPRSAS